MSQQGPPRGGQRPTRPPQGRPPGKGPAKRPAKRPAPRPAGDPPGRRGGLLDGVTGGDQQTTIGLALIGLAVVLGLVFLVKGFSDDGGLVASEAPETTSTTVPEVDRDAPPVVDSSTTVALTIRDPAEVPVLVANGSGVNGAAGRLAETLRAEEYNVVNTANALQAVTETQVLYAEDFQTEAETLAGVVGVETSAAQPLGATPPVDDLEGAEVVVVLGPDVAGQTGTATGGASSSSSSSSSTATTTG